MRDYLASIGVETVDLVIASHNHADHIGGLGEVVRRFRPRFYMDNAVPATTATYARVLDAVRDAGSEVLEPITRRIQLGEAALTVVPPPRITAWDQNDNSIGITAQLKLNPHYSRADPGSGGRRPSGRRHGSSSR